MTDLFDKLYSQFLRGKTNRKDFEGFKESLNHLSDQELAERMEAFWDENTVYPSMEVGRKREIHRRLRLQIHPPKISIRWSRIVAAAAVIAVLSVTAWNFSLLHELQNANSSFLAEVPAGDKVQLTLPDKSSVKLNSESSLSYAYVNGKRVARLKGEGYFQVSKDRKHPFVVQVGNLNIEVLGTCFNVYSYEENDFVETSLIEGSVRLYDSKSPSESFILKPSQKAIYSKKKKPRGRRIIWCSNRRSWVRCSKRSKDGMVCILTCYVRRLRTIRFPVLLRTNNFRMSWKL